MKTVYVTQLCENSILLVLPSSIAIKLCQHLLFGDGNTNANFRLTGSGINVKIILYILSYYLSTRNIPKFKKNGAIYIHNCERNTIDLYLHKLRILYFDILRYVYSFYPNWIYKTNWLRTITFLIYHLRWYPQQHFK